MVSESKKLLEDNIELYILKGLLCMPDYTSKYIEKLDMNFFSQHAGLILKCIQVWHMKYKKVPSTEILCDKLLPKACKEDTEMVDSCESLIFDVKSLQTNVTDFYEWLADETKNFIRTKRIQIALVDAVDMVEKGKINEATQVIIKASNIVFDETLGTDYFDDLEGRISSMKDPKKIISSGLSNVDKYIGGGWRPKSLVIFGAPTNGGKSLVIGDISYRLIEQGLNGLYITLEIAENILANRIDANLTNIRMSDLEQDPDMLMKRIVKEKKLREESGNPFGRLIIKEYPPGVLNANGLLALVRELELKRNNFKPDFICVDYLGLMAPNGKAFSDNSYGKLKSVSEELRAVASMLEVPIFTAVQVNREGFGSSIIGLENTADSMGIAHTADLMIMMARTEESDFNNTMCWHIAKSRFSKNGTSFYIKVDYDHMKLIDETTESVNKDKEEIASQTIKDKNAKKRGGLNDL